MQLQSNPIMLQQDVAILGRYMAPLSKKAIEGALCKHEETLDNYSMILPHMSSYYFEPVVKKIIGKLSPNGDVPYWTNLRTAGNTGAASIFRRVRDDGDGCGGFLCLPRSCLAVANLAGVFRSAASCLKKLSSDHRRGEMP
jgi:hypothetical protein